MVGVLCEAVGNHTGTDQHYRGHRLIPATVLFCPAPSPTRPHATGPARPASRQQRADALGALAHHLAAARASPQPQLGDDATSLLAAYFSHLRTFEEAQIGLLASLVRVACAVARLRHSPVVEALPDAALAVAFVEEKLAAAGATPIFWPRWRAELRRCTELGECLRGLVEECAQGLCCGDGGGGKRDAWMEQPEE